MKKAIRIFLTVVGALTVLFVVYLLLTVDQRRAAYTAAIEQDSAETYVTATPDGILTLVNKKRGEAGAEPLIVGNELQASAQWKAEDMANRGYFSHEDPSTNKNNGLDKAIELTGSFCSNVSENLYEGTGAYVTSQSSVDWWMGSQSHKDAMLATKYTYTGIGVATDKNGKVYQVQHFCQKQ